MGKVNWFRCGTLVGVFCFICLFAICFFKVSDPAIGSLLVLLGFFAIAFSVVLSITLSDEIRYLKSEQLARRVAHDLRSPVSAMRMLVFAMDDMEEKERDLMNKITDRIEHIADGVLEANKRRRLDATSLSDLSTWVGEILEEKKIMYPNFKFIFSPLVKDKLKAFCDQHMFKRILSNLINNAVEASTDKKQIIVSTGIDETNSLTVRIQDRGVGIPEDRIEDVLRGGFTTKENGCGIGLSSSVRDMQSIGGKLNIQSLPNQGTCISLQIPTLTTTSADS